MATEKKSILLRITPELWEQLNVWARDELRSVNAQIEYVLRNAVRRRVRGNNNDEPPPDGQDSAESDAP